MKLLLLANFKSELESKGYRTRNKKKFSNKFIIERRK